MTSVPTVQTMRQKVVLDWLTPLFRIREVSGSNLGVETGYPNFFVVFLSCSRKMQGYYIKLGHDRFLPYPFQFMR
jgi:hypothetical protein